MPSINSVLDVAVIIVLASVYVAALTVGSIGRYAQESLRRLIASMRKIVSGDGRSDQVVLDVQF